jgi:hypothetical protein
VRRPPGPARASSVVDAPELKYIAFTPAPGGIYVMRPDGSDLTLIEIEGLRADIEMPDWVA